MSLGNSTQLTSRIAIIGAGTVGSTIASSLLLDPVAGEILLIDPERELRDAQVQDLSDATDYSSSRTRIRAAEHKEAGQCDIVIVTAGAAQKKGESRTDLVGKNLKILKSVLDDCKPFKDEVLLLVVANPVDVLAYFAREYSGLKDHQVIGSGTFLDTARLKGILAEKAQVAASEIHAFVLGEHGESQMVAWSSATIAGIPMEKVIGKPELDLEAIAKDTKDKATEIINAKGATNFGIGGVVSAICKAILFDQRIIRPISHYQEEFECCLSMPVVLGRKGVVKSIPISLNEEEQEALKKSAKSLVEIIKEAR